MKKTLFFILLSLLCACGTLRQTPEEKRHIAEEVAKRLDAREYRIEVDYMSPVRGAGRAVSGGYSVTVDGNVVNSYLPYEGVAYNIPYGGGKGLIFKDGIVEYTDRGWSRGARVIVFSTNNGEDSIEYTLTIFDNGSADIHVRCRIRDSISYRGTLVTGDK